MAQSFDEVDDLTRFADESFNTDDVDLFEFTGVDDSPLMRLKSVILSLDWEITDDILDELAEEVTNLRTMWEGDKVAQVYLQGIEKVGKYLRQEGVYAHPNAIKLLLTLFYNYERIISSPDISGDEITTLLKSDIRKFKVLQYQIGNTEDAPQAPAEQLTKAPAESDEIGQDLLSEMNATILGLEWEVTDEGLERFKQQASTLRETLSGNDPALVLVQGLQALGSYITDEKAKAHPDAFTLLHSFFEGLMLLLGDEELATEKRQEILIDCVSRLNALKEIIANKPEAEPLDRGQAAVVDQILDLEATPTEQEPEPVIETPAKEPAAEEIPEDVFETPGAGESEELDFDFDFDETEEEQPTATADADETVASLSDDEEFAVDFDIEEKAAHANAAMETADEQYPEDILDPSAIRPVSDEIADDFIEEELKLSGGFTSALSDSTDDVEEFTLDDEGLSKEQLDEELELIFGDEGGGDELNLDTSADEGFEDFELSFDDEAEEEPASAFDLSEAISETAASDDSDLDFDDNLFLSEDEADLDTAAEDELVTPALADADDESAVTESYEPSELDNEPAADLEDKLDSLFGSSEEEEPEAALADEEDSVIPALDDADEETGFNEEYVAEGIADGPSEELEGKLDSFFGISEEEPDIDTEPAAVMEGESEEVIDDSVIAALSDTDDDVEGGFQEDEVVAELNEGPSAALQDKLDSFFGTDEEETAAQSTAAEEPALAEEDLDSFFAEDDSEIEPALADSDDSTGFNEEEAGTDVAESAMGELDSNLDSFFEEDSVEDDSSSNTAGTPLATLAAAASHFASSPAPAKLQQVAQLVTAQKNDNPSTQQAVILNLLESAVTLLSKNKQTAGSNSVIVQELSTDLEAADDAAMLQAVNIYTSWQLDYVAEIATAQPTAVSTPGLNENVTLQIKESFSQLRASLETEFATIRKELTTK